MSGIDKYKELFPAYAMASLEAEKLFGRSDGLLALSKSFEAHSLFNLSKSFQASNAFASLSVPAYSIPSFPVSSIPQAFFESVEQSQKWALKAIGPLHDIEKSIAHASETMEKERKQILAFSQEIESKFRFPAYAEAFRSVDEALKSISMPTIDSSKVFDAMEKMRAPWFDPGSELLSFTRFASLQDIGGALRLPQVFDDAVTERLRESLGDWRQPISITPNIIADFGARTDFYQDRGFDTALTDFPVAAFRESIVIAGLDSETHQVIEFPDYQIPAETTEDEAGFQRTNRAHNKLARFESRLRRFIDTKMTAAYGENWPKHRLPEPLYKLWVEKYEKAIQSGIGNHPLIAYADFTDYEPLLVRKDNWTEVFQPIFRRKESIQEALRRLYPIRLCTMHARFITQDDELLLHVEVKRLLKAISILND